MVKGVDLHGGSLGEFFLSVYTKIFNQITNPNQNVETSSEKLSVQWKILTNPSKDPGCSTKYKN